MSDETDVVVRQGMTFVPEWAQAIFDRFPIESVLDIGANRGDTVAIWLAAGAKCVHAMEPVEPLYKACVERFRDDPRVACHHIALSDVAHVEENLGLFNCWSLLPDGDTRLERSIEHWGETFTVKFETMDAWLESLTVARTLDEITVPMFTPDFLKIDVEGMEDKVLRGGSRYIREGKPIIMLEVSYLPKVYGDSCEGMIDRVFDLGYIIETFHAGAEGRVFHDTAAFMEIFPWHTSFDVLLVPRSP